MCGERRRSFSGIRRGNLQDERPVKDGWGERKTEGVRVSGIGED